MSGKRRKLLSNNALSSPYDSRQYENNLISIKQRLKRSQLQNASTSTKVNVISTNQVTAGEIAESTSILDHQLQSSNIEINESPHHVEQGHVEAEVSSAYIDIGDCNYVFQYCNANFWHEERVKSHCTRQSVRYNNYCCNGGKVILPSEPEPPDYIKNLYADKHFLENIRAPNQMFSMTSFGAHIDEYINCGKGPYVFKVSRQIYNWIGTLCPTKEIHHDFYNCIYMIQKNEVINRMCFFGGIESGNLSPTIVEGLIHFLDEYNELVKLFRTVRNICEENIVPDFSIKLYNLVGAREYELPTSETLGAIVFENGQSTETDYDVIIALKDGTPQRVNKLHPSYMSLQFPLLFIYGQPGFHPSMKLYNPHRPTSTQRGRLTRETNKYYYDRAALMKERDLIVPKLNIEQRKIYYLMINASQRNQQILLFVYGPVPKQSFGKQ